MGRFLLSRKLVSPAGDKNADQVCEAQEIRQFRRNTDTSDLMEDAQPGDLGNVADPEASVAFTVTMPNRVLRAARGIAAAEGVSTNDVLRRFIEAGVDDRAGAEASIPVSKLLRLIDEARGV